MRIVLAGGVGVLALGGLLGTCGTSREIEPRPVVPVVTTTPAEPTSIAPEPTRVRPSAPLPDVDQVDRRSGHPCLPGERDGDGDRRCGESR